MKKKNIYIHSIELEKICIDNADKKKFFAKTYGITI